MRLVVLRILAGAVQLRQKYSIRTDNFILRNYLHSTTVPDHLRQHIEIQSNGLKLNNKSNYVQK